MLRRLAPGVILGLVFPLASATSATGGPPVVCLPGTQICWVEVENPGTPQPDPVSNEGTSGRDGGRVCVIGRTGEALPCHDGTFGWFNDVDDCYYMLLDPQPPGDDPLWEGSYPSGAMYQVTCMDRIPGTNGGWTWLPAAPPGYGGIAITPAQLAARAVDQMRLAGPTIGITVPPDRTGLVGVPVWLWTEVAPTTWGPNSATAAVPGLSVTATAQVTQIAWDMGDGRTEVCTNAGTPWFEGGVESPTCDHVYEAPSVGQPDDAYTVTATSTWEVTWTGGGTFGALTVTRSSTTPVRIGELQVLVTN